MNEFLVSIGPAVGNHIWQSTVFAVAAGALAVLLKKNQAKTRYWIWLAAAIKFLVPFSLLIGVGNMLPRLQHVPVVAQTAYSAMDMVSEPFTESVLPVTAIYAPRNERHAMPGVIASVWLCGLVVVVLMWWRQWRRVAVVAREATEADGGREMDILRRLERDAGMRPMRLLLSRSSLEPGIFGVVRPVLIWPEGISARLSGGQMEAIVAHELCHVRRRDNLFAMAQMVVEAVFWFHPLVWWMGARMVEERERACDEEVLGRGSDPEVYAESVLKICEFCLESPLACVSGVTGADLKRRMVQIMAGRVDLKLGPGRKLLLLAVALVVVAVPVAFGLYRQTAVPDSLKVFHATGPMPSYEVATIKRPDESTEQGRGFIAGVIGPPGDGGATIRRYIQAAYGIPNGSAETRVVGGPAWIDSDAYIIQGKVPDEIRDAMQKMTPADRLNETRMMQQMLLQERFKLKVHFETRELPVFELVAAKGGLKIKEVPPPPPGPLPPRRAGEPLPPGMDMTRFGNGHVEMTAMATTMPAFINRIANEADVAGRPIVDKTGFTGNFDVVGMTWTSSRMAATLFGFGGTASPDPGGASLFTALEETLGMKLVPGKAQVEVVVIDSIERPSPN